jgi:hypothetical protein
MLVQTILDEFEQESSNGVAQPVPVKNSPKDSSVDLLPVVEACYHLSTLESLAEIFELLRY